MFVSVRNTLQEVKTVLQEIILRSDKTYHAAMASKLQEEEWRTIPWGFSEASGILQLQDLFFSGLHQHLSLVAHRHFVCCSAHLHLRNEAALQLFSQDCAHIGTITTPCVNTCPLKQPLHSEGR